MYLDNIHVSIFDIVEFYEPYFISADPVCIIPQYLLHLFFCELSGQSAATCLFRDIINRPGHYS